MLGSACIQTILFLHANGAIFYGDGTRKSNLSVIFLVITIECTEEFVLGARLQRISSPMLVFLGREGAVIFLLAFNIVAGKLLWLLNVEPARG